MKKKKRSNLHPNDSSLIINIQSVLNYRNIKHPMKFLIGIGINSASANKLLHGNAVQLNLIQLTAICTHLNCTPNDLFVKRNLELPEKHALHTIQDLNKDGKNINEYLAEKSIDELRNLLNN